MKFKEIQERDRKKVEEEGKIGEEEKKEDEMPAI